MILIALGGNNLNRLNVAVLGEAGIDQDVRPPVGPVGLHDQVFRQSYDDIRLADLPRLLVRELTRRRHVGGISLQRAAVHPLDDRRDFLVAQRLSLSKCCTPTFLSMNHGGISRAATFCLDGLCPRARLFVSHQRHRRNRARVMTDLAMLLEDRRHVLREGDLVLRLRPDGRTPASMRRSPSKVTSGEGGLHDFDSSLENSIRR